ncbi:ParA family protein [Chrysiogenes arsenatis]|uniref:ParA family protein n=1 Tax=Chrysiogenes arsenatis TaxID=309797 RepID=UPI0004264178|nr:hypothetical protein [Chrysiogenes arsenatis]
MICAVTHPRRGNFTTTVAVNLAASFAVREKRTLLIDVAGGDAGVLAGIPRNALGITDTIRERGEHCESHIQSTPLPFMDVLPFGTEGFGYGLFWEEYPWTLGKLEYYDIIVLDTDIRRFPPIMAKYWSHVLFPVATSPYIQEDMRAIESLCGMLDSRASIEYGVLGVGSEIPMPVSGAMALQTVIPVDASWRALSRPAVLHDLLSPLARCYFALAQELLKLSINKAGAVYA